jgi:hypothetical protein
MRRIFSTINDLLAQGIIQNYALGGSVGFMLWTQPFLTNDTDFFVQMAGEGLLVSLAPIYDYAEQHQFPLDHEHIVIDGEPVQIVPSPSPLYDEAIETAVSISVEGQSVKVMLPEYLVCTALAAGRMKDFAKIEKMLDEAEVDLEVLKDLIARFTLKAVWKRYCSAIGTTDSRWTYLASTKLAWRREQAQIPLREKWAILRRLRQASTRR